MSHLVSSVDIYRFADPFTGEARYVPGTAPPRQQGGAPAAANVTAADPFTGAAAYTTAAATDEKPLVPHDSYIR